jgi:hypothetical protein
MDAARLWAELPTGIAAFTDFAAAISAFLQRASGSTSGTP